jgi:hypothetical protein
MDTTFAERPAGEQLGIEGFDHFIERVEVLCECECQRIELANYPLITAKKAEYESELEKDAELKARVYQARPPHEHRARRRRIVYCWSVAAVLVVAGFVLSLLTLEPYHLGLKGLFYCVGIAVVAPYLVEKTLNTFSSEKLLRILVTISAIGALLSLMTLAVIRGELLTKKTQTDTASVVIEGEEPQTNQSNNSFYDDTVPLLQIVMALLAFSMEVGAGIAMHEAERVSANLGESFDELRHARERVQANLAALVQEIFTLQCEPAIFAAKFWRDFHSAVLKRSAGNAVKAFTIGVVALLLLGPSPAKAQKPLELVILIDLSRSVAASGLDKRSEFHKNVAAVSQLVRCVPAGAHITIVGISDNSFAHPYILLSATVALDAGYFGERLVQARQHLEVAWRNRSRELTPSSPGTDLLGAFCVASQIFQNAGAGRSDVLVVFSDMWQETRELDFGKMTDLCDSGIMERVKSRKPLADLRDADVYALGVDSAGRKRSGWDCAREFWTKYFADSGSNLREYSVLRDTTATLVHPGRSEQ